MYSCQNKDKLHLSTVKLGCGLISITPEIGDLYDIDFFCRYIGIPKGELMLLLANGEIPFVFHTSVLCFASEELAVKAIDKICAAVESKSDLNINHPVA